MISGIIVARALGVEGRGILALLWILPLMLSYLGGIGIPQATAYFVAREIANAAGVVRISVGITAVLAVLLTVAYGTALLLLAEAEPFSTTDGVLSACLVSLFLAHNLGTASLLGLGRYHAFNVSRIAPTLLYATGAATVFALDEATLTVVLATSMTSWLLGAAITWSLVFTRLPPGRNPSEATPKRVLGFGARGILGGISAIDDVRLDQIFVGIAMNARSLGLYVAAIAFCNLPRFVAQSIGSVAFPRIASASGPRVAWAQTRRTFRIGLAIITLCTGALLLALPFLLPFLFGEAFRDAVPIGRILLVAAYFLSIHRLLNELARGLGHPGYGSITELVNLIVFLLGLAVFATPASTEGVALAVVAGGLTSASLLALLVFRLRPGRDDPRGTGGATMAEPG